MHWGIRMVRKRAHVDLMVVMKYDPNQPREPAGSSKGGQFASSGGQFPSSRDLGPRQRGIEGSTVNMHVGKDGRYTKARAKLHDRLLHEVIDRVPDAKGQPTVYMTGGGPASGKSSVLESGQVGFPTNEQAVYISADDFKAMLPEYQALTKIGDRDAGAKAHDESSDLSWMALSIASRTKDVVFDGTGNNSIEKLAERVAKMRAAGARVVATYVSQPVEQALKNEQRRFEKTGRGVPEATLREIHQRVSQIFPEAIARGLFDEAQLFDTSVLGKPRLVVSHKDGVTTIHDKELYGQFLAKGRV